MIFAVVKSFTSSYHITGIYKLNLQLTCSRGGFIAQSVEHRTGITEVMGSNPVEASDFFLGSVCNLLHNCEDHFHFYLHIIIIKK